MKDEVKRVKSVGDKLSPTEICCTKNNVTSNFTPQTSQLRIDERKHVEKPLLDQLGGLKWEILDLDSKQHPSESFRRSFTEVVKLPVLRGWLRGQACFCAFRCVHSHL